MSDLSHEEAHRVALARELTYAAGFPLRDRWGFAASDDDVLYVVAVLFGESDDVAAAQRIGLAGALGDINLAEGYDTHTSEEYETGIVAALRPLVAQRRAAEVRAQQPIEPLLDGPRSLCGEPDCQDGRVNVPGHDGLCVECVRLGNVDPATGAVLV